ncbi:MAG TPA: DMT family transporter [Alphaproteobacteria bacterium]|nr:DMT family transporter [Alphaproteobacteria bacterium]
MTALLFATIVLAWGFTWFAIKLQLGAVPMEVSIFWRFAVATALLALGLAATKRLKPVPLAQHRWLAAMGMCLFTLNFLLIYAATQYIASGVVSVVFTLATIFNAFNQWLFLGRRPGPRALLGGALGITGLALLFGEELARIEAGAAAGLGIGLALLGTYVFSLGNLASLRATAGGVDLPNAVLRGMGWGTCFLAFYLLVRGDSFRPALTAIYLGSLAYLAVVGSVVGFLAYLSLVARVGADRAAYATVLFPLVALSVSTLLEGYAWTPLAVAGLPLILLGNVVIFARLPRSGIAVGPRSP